jgi:hypothetical protein
MCVCACGVRVRVRANVCVRAYVCVARPNNLNPRTPRLVVRTSWSSKCFVVVREWCGVGNSSSHPTSISRQFTYPQRYSRERVRRWTAATLSDGIPTLPLYQAPVLLYPGEPTVCVCVCVCVCCDNTV